MHSRAKEIFIDYTSSISEQKVEEEKKCLSYGLCVPPPPPSPTFGANSETCPCIVKGEKLEIWMGLEFVRLSHVLPGLNTCYWRVSSPQRGEGGRGECILRREVPSMRISSFGSSSLQRACPTGTDGRKECIFLFDYKIEQISNGYY